MEYFHTRYVESNCYDNNQNQTEANSILQLTVEQIVNAAILIAMAYEKP